ncbi:MAG: zf-TFIIB domain-containing protein [Tepidisphaerales bacterium]
MPAATFNCPSCGAEVSQESTQCGHCGSLLQTVACPSCFGLIFLGSKFCSHCGARVQTPTREQSAAGLACPRCQGKLAAASVGGMPLEECMRCGGLWIGSETFQRICSDRESQAAALALQVPAETPVEEPVRYLKCPQCSQLMIRRSYALRSGVILDICRAHGIWFDRDELRRIIEFIRSGGLDRARQAEKEELDRDRARLEAERSSCASHASAMLQSGGDDDEESGSLLRGIGALVAWLLK